jgi:hypothetical protein
MESIVDRPAPVRIRRAPGPHQPEIHASYEELMASTAPSAYVQGALAVDFRPAAAAGVRRAVAAIQEAYDDSAPKATPTVDLPDARQWGGRIAQAIAEVLAGTRSPAQVVRWTTPEIHAQIARLASTSARREGLRRATARRSVVRAVRCEQSRDGSAEIAAVLDDGRRARALALQLTGLDGRWRVTAWRLL